MILKKKPQKPKRKTILETFDCEDTSLQYLVKWAERFEGIEFKDVRISNSFSYHDDCSQTEASLERKETDKEFQVRLHAHNRRLETYNDWYSKNREEIEEELSRRELAHRQRANRNLERERARLEKALAKLDKK